MNADRPADSRRVRRPIRLGAVAVARNARNGHDSGVSNPGVMDMSTVPASERTLADFLKDLGDIPPYRIRMFPPPGKATEKDVIRILDRENRLFELVDGVLVEKAIGWAESAIGGTLFRRMGDFVEQHDLGITIPADGPV